MNQHRIFILGKSLLSNSLVRLLDQSPKIAVVGSATTTEEALVVTAGKQFDALIVIGTDDQTTVRFCPILAKYPDLPVIRADISQNTIQIITSQNIEADTNDCCFTET